MKKNYGTKWVFSLMIIFLMFVVSGCLTTGTIASTTTGTSAGRTCSYEGSPQQSITISGISDVYNGKMGWITLDVGGTSVGWGYSTIAGGSVTIQLACWAHDAPFSRDGAYSVFFLVYENALAARAGNVEWGGTILTQRQISGTNTAIPIGDFFQTHP